MSVYFIRCIINVNVWSEIAEKQFDPPLLIQLSARTQSRHLNKAPKCSTPPHITRAAIRRDSSRPRMTFPRAFLFLQCKQSCARDGANAGTLARAEPRCVFKNLPLHIPPTIKRQTAVFYVCVKYPSVQHLRDSLFADRLIVALVFSHCSSKH